MSEHKFEIEALSPRKMFAEKERVVVNPNPGREYVTAYKGQEYVFPPMEPVAISDSIADWLLARAIKNKDSSHYRAKQCGMAYAKMVSSKEMHHQMMAQNYVKFDKDGNPIPLFEPWARTPLVDLSTKPGQDLYLEAKAEMERGEFVPKELPSGLPSLEWGVDGLRTFIKSRGGKYHHLAKEQSLLETANELLTEEELEG